MGKLSLFVAFWFLAGTVLLTPHPASGMTDEETRAAFLRSRESRPASNARPAQAKPDGKPDAEPQATPKRKSKPKPKPARKKKHRETAHPTPTPHPKPTPSPEPKPTPTPEPKPTPEKKTGEPSKPVRPSPTPAPSAAKRGGAAIVVQKSGGTEDEEPLPTPPPEKKGKWWWPFGREKTYKYLTPALRRAIDKAPVARHRWRYIVVHNSGTRQGNAKAFDYYHLHVRKMPNGLAYHFVIGNGTSSGNGAIEIGNRWTRQINGGHVHSDFLNNIALGICLVGDFNRDTPTKQQLEALDELIRYLRNRVGKTDHKLATVKSHKDINPARWPTDCPGDKFPYRWLYTRFD